MRRPEIEPRIFEEWQEITNLVANLCGIPSALLMRINEDSMEVISASQHPDSPYKASETAPLEGKLYCETVIKTQRPLHVPNALKDPDWDHNPDIELGMISYYGVPVNWPDKQPFGTLCMLDKVERHATDGEQEIINRFARILELTLELIISNHEQKLTLEAFSKAEKIVHLGSWDWNIVDNKLYWSDEIYRIFGLTPQEFGATYDAFMEFIHPDDREKVLQAVDDALSGNPYVIEHRLIRKDGGERIVQEMGSVKFDASGKPVRMLGSVHDITEQRHMEQQLHHSSKMEALGTLIGGIAHDFNNKLGAVTGSLYLARKEASSIPKLSERLRDAETQCFKVADKIKQLMTITRRDLLIQKDHMELNACLQNVLSSASLDHIAVERNLCEKNLVINGAQLQIQKAVENILNNAVDAVVEKTHPAIRIMSEVVEANDELRNKHPHLIGDHFAHMKVVDNGVGIPAAALEHVFEPFFTTKDAIKGQGLGLSVAYGLVQNHNGSIDISSSAGVGTSVHIYLPLVEDIKQ